MDLDRFCDRSINFDQSTLLYFQFITKLYFCFHFFNSPDGMPGRQGPRGENAFDGPPGPKGERGDRGDDCKKII